MNYRDLILSTIRGVTTEVLPFVPRLDLWYKANKQNGSLPDSYKDAELRDIIDDLGVGYHAIIPDFREYEDKNGDVDLGLGIYRFKSIPYSVELNNVRRSVHRDGGLTSIEYSTPYGNIHTKVLYDETMKKSGATHAHIIEYAIKGIQDFEAIAYIFDNAEIRPNYSHYMEYKEYVGHRGIVAAFNSLSASPMHFIMKELMSIETFSYESFDHPDELKWLAEIISGYYNRIFDIVALSPSEIILSGANYHSSITSPPFFEQHIAPSLKRQADVLHQTGKYLLTHTDGENRGLLKAYLDSGFDIADSICPSPMTSIALKDTREVLNSKITIWGGIPSICVLEESMSDKEFEIYLDMTLESIGSGDHMIFSIADTTPPGAKFERIKTIARKIREFGPVKGVGMPLTCSPKNI